MKKTILATALLLAPLVSSAAITSYTNQALWSAAAGTTSLHDFNSDANGSALRDFGDFTGTLVNSVGSIPQVLNNEIQLQGSNSNTWFKVTFDSSMSAFGFTWRNTDPSGDKIELNVLGENFIFGPRGSGFFGITSTSLFTEALLGDSAGNGGFLGYGYVDNFQYGAGTPGQVPIPAAAFMFAPALLGFMGLRRKAKNKAV